MTLTLLTRAGTFCAVALISACGSNGDLTSVRDGPQAVHPSPSALAQRHSATAQGTHTKPAMAQPAAANGAGETQQIFQTYCTDGVDNNTRLAAVLDSGRFGKMQLGALPVVGYEGVVFAFYKLKSGNAQIGFGSRRGLENYCVAVDGTRTGNDFYVTKD